MPASCTPPSSKIFPSSSLREKTFSCWKKSWPLYPIYAPIDALAIVNTRDMIHSTIPATARFLAIIPIPIGYLYYSKNAVKSKIDFTAHHLMGLRGIFCLWDPQHLLFHWQIFILASLLGSQEHFLSLRPTAPTFSLTFFYFVYSLGSQEVKIRLRPKRRYLTIWRYVSGIWIWKECESIFTENG